MKRLTLFAAIVAVGCSPLRSSPNEEKHQLELTLHGLQTNLDDLRHDFNCIHTELQIIDGRIKYYENAVVSLKQQEFEKQQLRIDQFVVQLASLEKKLSAFEQFREVSDHDMHQLTDYANETNAALVQFKQRIFELEQALYSQCHQFNEISKLKTQLEELCKHLTASAKMYKVKPGDSLEKIARMHKTTAQRIKQANNLEHDLIVAGQELRISE